MKKLTITFRTPNIGKDKDGKPAIVYDELTETHIVASTKSENNLIDDLKLQNKIAHTVKVEELFLDRKTVTEQLATTIKAVIKDEIIQTAILNHAVKALDGACLFERPPVVRGKAAEPQATETQKPTPAKK